MPDSFAKGQAMFPEMHRGSLFTPPSHDEFHPINFGTGEVEQHAKAAASHAPYAKVYTRVDSAI